MAVADALDPDSVNNAAQSAVPERSVTEEGLVLSMAINYFGPFTLTTSLLPLLRAAMAAPDSDVRIVNVRFY